MPKIPKISGNQLIKYLQRRGFVMVHRKGSHATMVNDHIFTTVPAGNRILKTGMILGVLSDANIGREEFVRDYNNKLVK